MIGGTTKDQEDPRTLLILQLASQGAFVPPTVSNNTIQAPSSNMAIPSSRDVFKLPSNLRRPPPSHLIPQRPQTQSVMPAPSSAYDSVARLSAAAVAAKLQHQDPRALLAMTMMARNNGSLPSTATTATALVNQQQQKHIHALNNMSSKPRRLSHSAEAIHRARIGMMMGQHRPVSSAAVGSMPTANNLVPSSKSGLSCLPRLHNALIPNNHSIEASSFLPLDQLEPTPLPPSHPKSLVAAAVAALPIPVSQSATPPAPAQEEQKLRRSSVSASVSPLTLDLPTLPPPAEDSWMHEIDLVHPSPQIKTTEDNAVSPTVEPDKAMANPVQEDDISRYDILSGRGGKTNNHEGNIKFRSLVSKYKAIYAGSKKYNKRQMVGRIALFIRQGRGRFLQKGKDGCWYEIGDEKAYSKIAQSMREGAPASSLLGQVFPLLEALKQQQQNSSGTSIPSFSFSEEEEDEGETTRGMIATSTSSSSVSSSCCESPTLMIAKKGTTSNPSSSSSLPLRKRKHY